MKHRLGRTLALLCALLGLALCEACNGPGGEELTPESELPPDYAGAWRAWYRDDPSWPAWRERVPRDERLADFFVDNLLRVMVKHYDHAAITRAGQLPGLFERSRRELLFLRERSAPVLVELIFEADQVVSFLAGDLLVEIDDGRWTLPLAKKLEGERSESRRRAAEWLARLPHAGADEPAIWALLERSVLEDGEWFVRAQAATSVGQRALATGGLQRARPLLSRALVDPDPAVVRAACGGLETSGDLRALPALINLHERLEKGAGELATLRATRRALEVLSGASGLDSAAEWRAWWRENRPAGGDSRP